MRSRTKKRMLAALFAVMLAALLLSFAAFRPVRAENIDGVEMVTWSSGTAAAGGAKVVDGITYENPGADFWIGKNTEGRLIWLSESNNFAAKTDYRMYLDGARIGMVLGTKQLGETKTLADGTSFMIGWRGKQTDWPGLSLRANWKTDKFNLSITGAAASEGNGGKKVDEVAMTANLGDTISIALDKNSEAKWMLTIQVGEGAAKSFDVSGAVPEFNSAWCYLADEAEDYYGTLYANYNALGQQTVSPKGKITFTKLVDGAHPAKDTLFDASDDTTWAADTKIGSVANDFYQVVYTAGENKGLSAFASLNNTTTDFSWIYTDAMKASGAQIDYSLASAAGGSLEFRFQKTDAAADTDWFAFRFVYTAADKAAVFYADPANADGISLGTVGLDWTGNTLYQLQLFYDAEGATLVANGGLVELGDNVPYALIAVADGFTDGNAYLQVIARGAESTVGIASVVRDGTAERKNLVGSFDIAWDADKDIAFGTTDVAEPEKVTVHYTDVNGESKTAEWNLIWGGKKIDTGYPASYKRQAAIENLDTLKETFLIPNSLLKQLVYNAKVGYPSDMERGKGDHENPVGLWWNNTSAGSFLYKMAGDGTETLMSDGYATSMQFTPVNQIQPDLDGYSIEFKMNTFDSTSNTFGIQFMTEYAMNIEARRTYGFLITTDGNKMYLRYYSKLTESPAIRQVIVAFKKEGTKLFSDILDYKTKTLKLILSHEGTNIAFKFAIDGVEYDLVPSATPEKPFEGVNGCDFDKAFVCLWNEAGPVRFDFRQTYKQYVKALPEIADKSVAFGEAHGLPATVEVECENGSKADAAVTWTGNFKSTTPGAYEMTGTLSSDLGFLEGVARTVKVNVTVEAEAFEVLSFGSIAEVKTVVGRAPTLPETVDARVKSKYDGSEREVKLPVTWAAADVSAAGTKQVAGTLGTGYTLAAGVSAPKISVKVEVETFTITAFPKQENVKIKLGESLSLPSKITVTVKSDFDGGTSEREVDVTWSAVDTNAAGNYTATATIAGYELAEGVSANMTVTVTVEKGGCAGGTVGDLAGIAGFGALIAALGALLALRRRRA